MYLQKIQRSTLSPLDDEQCYINKIESKIGVSTDRLQ